MLSQCGRELKVKNVKTDLTLDRRSINEKRDRVEQPLRIQPAARFPR
jgi:hypothetical protein